MRQTSPQYMFEQMALEHRPQFSFESGRDWASWKSEALPLVRATLGDFPPRVPAAPLLIALWESDGLKQQRWLIDVAPHASVVLHINFPLDLKDDEKRPPILCWHGHGRFGKDSVMGNESSIERKAEVGLHNYDYGRQMAQAGFITFAIDWMGAGDRNDSTIHHLSHNAGRDWCNLYYLHATLLGMTNLGINIAHGIAATDFVLSLPNVDSENLGVMGLSGGGTMTLWSALCDERIKATEIICYSDLWAAFGFRDLNYCGMQVAPGLHSLVDVPDLQGLLAPRPLLIDIGLLDDCFKIETSSQCFERLSQIYDAANASAHLELDLFPDNHGWGGNKSRAFFNRHLRGKS